MSFFPRALAAPAEMPVPAVEWEEPNCLLCGGRRWVPLIEAPDHVPGGRGLWFAVVQCQDCGLCFTNPRPTFVSIRQFYPDDYWPERAPSPRQRHVVRDRPRRRKWYRLRNERRGLDWTGEGRLLDFGCGGGAFLERMHRQGWQVTGLDLSAAAIRQVRNELQLRGLVGTLPHPDLQPGSFDVVTMWHSLEHCHQPREVLRHAHDLLAPGGQLLVAVPNIDSLPFRWFGRSWYGLDLPRHLTHFAPRTLVWMLERSGFRVKSLHQVRQSGWLRTSARLAAGAGPGTAWQRWLQRKPAARLATWYGFLRQECDCMLAKAERVP